MYLFCDKDNTEADAPDSGGAERRGHSNKPLLVVMTKLIIQNPQTMSCASYL